MPGQSVANSLPIALQFIGDAIYILQCRSENTGNSRSQKFSWESAWFLLAQHWDIIFCFLFLSQNMRFTEKYTRFLLKKARYRKKEILVLISKHGTDRTKFAFLYPNTRLKERNSLSRLNSWNRLLVRRWWRIQCAWGKFLADCKFSRQPETTCNL